MSQIAFSEIDKAFGKRQILQGVEMRLQSGQCFLLSGPNGAGKSTLQRICAGLEKPDTGWIDTGMGARTWRQQRQVLQTSCVYLHQQPFMFDGTVRQNLAYPKTLVKSKQERLARIEIALDWAGLEPIADCWAKTLSGGERQRVALARAWLRSPRYMLLDEPTNNLDDDAKQRTLSLLQSLKAQGIGLLIASHEAEHFQPVADGLFELSAAKIIHKIPTSTHKDNVITLAKTRQVGA
jgi:tungstate transport system ATP-binding protein